MEYYPTVKLNKPKVYTTWKNLTMLNERNVAEDDILYDFIKLQSITYNSKYSMNQP